MGRTLSVAIVCLAFASAAAKEGDDDTQAQETETPTSSTNVLSVGGARGGDEVPPAYSGVAPGATNLPPKAPRMPLKKGPQRLTWSGFQVRDGVPTVFLETTGTPDYSVDERPGQLVVTLRNTVVPVRNNRRPLKVQAFGTSVQEVDTDTHGKSTRIIIHTKEKAPPSHKEHTEAAAGGFQMLLIELR